MSNQKSVLFWKSGSVRGYNGDGIKITATSRFRGAIPANGSVDLRFLDNSCRPNGPFSRIRSFALATEGWVSIPLPDPDGKFGEGVNVGFTIHGQIKLERRTGGPFLRLRFNWGEGLVHAEEGIIMSLGNIGG